MTLKTMLKEMRSQTPKKTLIDIDSYEELPEYFDPYAADPEKTDQYYLGIKYATLETITDDMDEFLDFVDVAIQNYHYKWATQYETTQLEYDPIANVDAEIIETRDIDKRHNTDTIGGADVTTTNGAAPMDSNTFHNQTESNTVSLEHTDEHDEDAYKDTITTTRKGNIGITSSQSLIEEQRRIADMNFLDVFMYDIISFLTFPMFGGE